MAQNNNRSNGLDAIDDNNENTKLLKIPGFEDGNFYKILCHFKEKEEHTFARFTALMRRLERSFHGIISDPKHGGLIWLGSLT
ncbi:MAG: hypothetical protein GDA43_24565 [Hormoscilla sp. SP5CHS1]|nr:hypothetical protein [Hormoscilla sp. SP12CHS1]MBC6455964.1 hypothetical protein [Hormoscilla sp. SP5CHS1]